MGKFRDLRWRRKITKYPVFFGTSVTRQQASHASGQKNSPDFRNQFAVQPLSCLLVRPQTNKGHLKYNLTMKDGKNNMVKQKPRWSPIDHPVVSTVLWMLGHKKRTSRPEESNSTLSWKDDHGGKIAEYLSEVQQKAPATSSNGTTLLTQAELSSKSRHLTGPTNQDMMVAEMRRLGAVNGANGGEGDSESPFLPSPQWGQYVPITPPEQEMFSKATVQQIWKPQEAINVKVEHPLPPHPHPPPPHSPPHALRHHHVHTKGIEN